MLKFVKVKFNNSSKLYDYICDIDDISKGDYVYVDTKRGEKLVEVYAVFYSELSDMPLSAERYKRVVAKADKIKETNSWTKKCPFCQSTDVAKYVYGLLEPNNKELADDIKRGRIICGGCLIGDNNPKYRCNKCGQDFGYPNGRKTEILEDKTEKTGLPRRRKTLAHEMLVDAVVYAIIIIAIIYSYWYR